MASVARAMLPFATRGGLERLQRKPRTRRSTLSPSPSGDRAESGNQPPASRCPSAAPCLSGNAEIEATSRRHLHSSARRNSEEHPTKTGGHRATGIL
eukprot:scaffold16_cov242-Pinguiococcus_pyrenoidosus.AAC.22